MDTTIGAHGERPTSFADQSKTTPAGLVSEFVRAGYGTSVPQNVYEPVPPPYGSAPGIEQQPIPGNGRIWQSQPQPGSDNQQPSPQPTAPITLDPLDPSTWRVPALPRPGLPAQAPQGDIKVPILRPGKPAVIYDREIFKSSDWQAQLYEKASPSIVKIDIERKNTDGKTEVGAATGFFVSADGLIATDNHVAADGDAFKVHLADGRTFNAHFVDRRAGDDLAVMQIDGAQGEKFPSLPLATNDSALKSGDQVVMLGHPEGWPDIFLSQGTFDHSAVQEDTGASDIPDNPHRQILKFHLHGEAGNSGSPVLNEQGQVVGLLDAGYNKDTSDSLVNPVDDLRTMVPPYKDNEHLGLSDYLIPSGLHFSYSQLPLAAVMGLRGYATLRALSSGTDLTTTRPSWALPVLGTFDFLRTDLPFLKSSVSHGTTAERITAGIDVGSDLLMMSGFAGYFIPGARPLVNALQLVGGGLKLGNDILSQRRY